MRTLPFWTTPWSCLQGPPLLPWTPLLSPASLSPCSEADELAAQGADGDAELPPVLPGDSGWAAREAAEAGLYLGAGSS